MQNVDDDFLLEVVLKTIINKVALGEIAPKLAAGVVIECYDRRKQNTLRTPAAARWLKSSEGSHHRHECQRVGIIFQVASKDRIITMTRLIINQKPCDGVADAEADERSGNDVEDDGRAAGRERISKMRSGQRLRKFLDRPSETGDLLGMSSYLELRSVALPR